MWLEVFRREIAVGNDALRPLGDGPRIGAGIHGDAIGSHRHHVPRPVGSARADDDTCIGVVEHHAVDHDGRSTAVVDDVVVTDDVRHAAAVEIYVEVEPGLDGVSALDRRVSGHANRDPGIRANGPRRPDVDPASSGKKDSHPIAGSTGDATVHPDRLPPVALRVERCGPLHLAVFVDGAHEYAVGSRAAGADRPPDGDVDRVRRVPDLGISDAEVIGGDAVAVFSCRGEAMPVSSCDVDVAVTLVTAMDAVRECAGRRKGATREVDADVADSVMPSLDAMGQSADSPVYARPRRRNGGVFDADDDVAGGFECVGGRGILQSGANADGARPRRLDAAAFDVDVDIAVGGMVAVDPAAALAECLDGDVHHVDVHVARPQPAEAADAVGVVTVYGDFGGY